MARNCKTLTIEGAGNQALVNLVRKHHAKKTFQGEVADILEDKGYSTKSGALITEDSVRRFERLIGLPSRRH